MNERKHLVTLVLSVVLFAFSMGVLFARGAWAQAIVPTPPYPFPKVSELWSMRIDPANYTTVDLAEGYQVSGYRFTISADHAGRLPVVTAFLARATNQYQAGLDPVIQDGVFELWQQGPDGHYVRIFFQNSSHPSFDASGFPIRGNNPEPAGELGEGLVLRPGTYLYRLPEDTQPNDWSRDTAMSGYWARP